jgi:hypothetical protein
VQMESMAFAWKVFKRLDETASKDRIYGKCNAKGNSNAFVIIETTGVYEHGEHTLCTEVLGRARQLWSKVAH